MTPIDVQDVFTLAKTIRTKNKLPQIIFFLVRNRLIPNTQEESINSNEIFYVTLIRS